MDNRQKLPDIKETRLNILAELRAQVRFLNEHSSADNPLFITATSHAINSLLEAYINSLPPTYKETVDNDG
jgi:hypothetical protein